MSDYDHYDPMDDVAQIELNEDRWNEYGEAIAGSLGIDARAAKAVAEAWSRAGYELYQNFSGVRAGDYPEVDAFTEPIISAIKAAMGN